MLWINISKPPPYDGMDVMLANLESIQLKMDAVIHRPIN